MKWSRSLVGTSIVLVLVGSLAWAGEPVPMFGDFTIRVPEVRTLRGAFKIAENESPQPQSRFYWTYNYFNDVRAKYTYLSTVGTDLRPRLLHHGAAPQW